MADPWKGEDSYRYISKPGHLKWKKKARIGSLANIDHVPGGGNVAIVSNPVNWQRKARIGSLENIDHIPQGGTNKVFMETPKWEQKSKIGSLDNINHKPSGGNVNIYDVTTTMRWGKWKPLPNIGTADVPEQLNTENRPQVSYYRTSNTGALEYQRTRPLSRSTECFTKTEPNPDFDYNAFMKSLDDKEHQEEEMTKSNTQHKSKQLKPIIHKKNDQSSKPKIPVEDFSNGKRSPREPNKNSNTDVDYGKRDMLNATTGYSTEFIDSADSTSKSHEKPHSREKSRNNSQTYQWLYKKNKENVNTYSTRYQTRSPYMMQSVKLQQDNPNVSKKVKRPLGYLPQEHQNGSSIARSKVDSRDNVYHKPGGGNLHIRTSPTLWPAKPKVGSLDNYGHQPGGGRVKIPNHKLGWDTQSRVNARLEGFYIQPT